MTNRVTIRRTLAFCLAMFVLGPIAWLDFQPASQRSASHLGRQLQLPLHRTALSSGKGAWADQTTHWLPDVPAAFDDFHPQWDVAILANRESTGFVPLPGATARFGRAPPSSTV